MNKFEDRIAEFTGGGLTGMGIKTLQVNVGLRCNQACHHCHLEASPHRREAMEWPIMARVLDAARETQCQQVDITGGSPEMNPHFRRFVTALRREGFQVQVRTNLTVFFETGFEGMPEFFRAHEIHLVASMPCYLEENVRAQRGAGAYEKSVTALRRLNALGYGSEPSLPLNLVYNPGGPFLPPLQSALEADYRRQLGQRFGVVFTRLLTLTNMPLGRFRAELSRRNEEQTYLQLLRQSFNPQTVESLMCRNQISVGWDGTLYDCDFNLAIGLPVDHGAPSHIQAFRSSELRRRRIVTGEHCFGCTAGFGSSCGGALAG